MNIGLQKMEVRRVKSYSWVIFK